MRDDVVGPVGDCRDLGEAVFATVFADGVVAHVGVDIDQGDVESLLGVLLVDAGEFGSVGIGNGAVLSDEKEGYGFGVTRLERGALDAVDVGEREVGVLDRVGR